jgi:multidrug efflux pump subunit AcrA (membrane-fusion protein)
VICIGAVAWHGHSPQPEIHNAIRTEKVGPSLTVAGLETAELQKKLVVAQESLDETRTRADEDEKHLVKLGNAKDLLLAQVAQLEQKNQSISDSMALAAQQRDELQKQLDDSSRSLEQTREDLNHAREDRTASMLRLAGLERQVDTLRSMAGAAIGDTPSDEQLLTKDRDIRELMGARQLYIADVFDIQHDGQPSKPFGRVFYTKGKSLIFYAFDLQTQPGSVDAKAFQAWGRRDVPSAKPVSLGIFYLDSEQNRRWIVKTTDSNVLAKINAVFVTVEPRGGSPQPTGKPFLEAYLHTLPPNHP